MAKRRVKQVSKKVIWYDSAVGEHYVTEQNGKLLKDGFYSQKQAEAFCKQTNPKTKENTPVEEWSDEEVMSINPMKDDRTKSGVPLPKEGAYPRDLNGINRLFEERITRMDENTKERLAHYYREFENRKQPAYERIEEAICIASTKVRAEQRTIAYIIGIMKKWLEHGYGNNVQEEHRKLMHYFEQKFNVTMSEKAKTQMLAMISTYGIVDILATVLQMELPEQDLSSYYVELLDFKINEGLQAG